MVAREVVTIKGFESDRRVVWTNVVFLTERGYPVLPVAPRQCPYQYPRVVKADPKRGTGEHCPFNREALRDGRFEPDPKFTGKNPSYLDSQGKPHLVNHKFYQDRLPTEAERKLWTANLANGYGVLCGRRLHKIDLDRKHFGSQEECDQAKDAILEKISAETWVEKTHSGGYRIAIKLDQEPGFTNFALHPGGKHVGEVLGKGRFAVLAPTIGPSGNAYITLNLAEPVKVESLESIGIFPVGKPKPPASVARPKPVQAVPGSIPLDLLLTDDCCRILNGEDLKGDRSASLTTLLQESYGWQNWCNLNGVGYRDSAEELALWAGERLGLDSDRVDRIIASVPDPASCQPAAYLKGGDESCWLKIKRLDRKIYLDKFPSQVKSGSSESNRSQDDDKPSKLALSIARFSEVFGDRLRFNQVTGCYEFDGKATTLEELEISLALDFNLDAPRNFALVVKAIAKTYHPVKEYLEECYAKHGENTISVLDGIAERHFGTSKPLHQLFLRKWLIGVARRVFEPGAKFDTVLTLHGKQGLQKSSWFRELANGYFDDSIGNVSDKDERIKLHRSWLNEWGEVEAVFRRKDIALIKSFVTSQIDRLRPPYGREVVDMPRWSAIVASTNQDEFLADATGNRRFWVIPVKQRIDLELLKQERDQIWAAAVALYFQGEPHWLDADGEEAAAEAVKLYESSDPWEGAILEYLDGSERTETAVEDLLFTVLQIELKDLDRQKQMRVGDILRRAGWFRTERREVRNGKRVRLWHRGAQSTTVEAMPQPESVEQPQLSPVDSAQSAKPTITSALSAAKLTPGSTVTYKGRQYPDLNSGQLLTIHSRDPGSGYLCVTVPKTGRLSTWIAPSEFEPNDTDEWEEF
jgi:predicted P-loop ATPase